MPYEIHLSGQYEAMFTCVGAYDPPGVPSKADASILYYQLIVGPSTFPGRRFLPAGLWSPCGRFFAVEEWYGECEDLGRRDTLLVLIDTETWQECVVSSQPHGEIRPEAFEKDRLLYAKIDIHAPAVVSHFERDITLLTAWCLCWIGAD